LTTIFILLLSALPLASHGYSVAQEIKLGQDTAKEVEKEMPLSKNEKWQQDITQMGQRFMPYIKRKEIPYHFYVIEDSNHINAFSLPGGYVYFSERMWKIMTPDERAGVMAHEITHCDRRHAVNAMLKSEQTMLWTLPLIIASGGAAALAVGVGNAVIDQRYSRKIEREADEYGMKLDKAAGFNPAGMVTAMKKLLHIECNENRYEVSDILADHPDTKLRVQYLTQEAEAFGAKPSELELKTVDDPSRLGNIVRINSELGIIYARCDDALYYGDKVLIKKMLWDDNLNAIIPRPVAVATVLTPGEYAGLLVEKEKSAAVSDIMEGDGVYPIPVEAPTTVPLPATLQPAPPVVF